MFNKDEVQGKADQVKGNIKKAVGDLTDNDQLHDEGEVDETAGEVQQAFGKGRRKLGEAIENIGSDIKR